MQTDPRQLVDPAFFARLDSIELRAKGIVEGFLHGLHRSPFIGYSVEFASHREYSPGDDLRHVNWKLYSRTKRLYVKEFDAETNLNLYILLDVSRSMDCANNGLSKRDYGASLAAALAHLALKQHDAAGITLFADDVIAHVEPKSKPQQLDEILRAIAQTESRAGVGSGRALQQAAELARHRGLVVLISDLFDDLAPIVQALEHLRFRNHEVLLFHLWDLWERRLPLEGNVRFHDLETGESISAQAEGIRDAYQRRVDRWCEQVEAECLNRGIERIELTTDQPLDKALLDYLVQRAKVI
ncbi:MAG: DUF58 domain-containing protein [Planctomycetaceae bacterium]|nr:DUF58 domain-containing protein [Planctomycetaceae bacterium]